VPKSTWVHSSTAIIHALRQTDGILRVDIQEPRTRAKRGEPFALGPCRLYLSMIPKTCTTFEGHHRYCIYLVHVFEPCLECVRTLLTCLSIVPDPRKCGVQCGILERAFLISLGASRLSAAMHWHSSTVTGSINNRHGADCTTAVLALVGLRRVQHILDRAAISRPCFQ
jgi:hypothetical protein